METPVLTGLALIISNIGSVVTGAVGWVGDYVGALTTSGNELLLLFVCLPLVGLGVGLIKRMISL